MGGHALPHHPLHPGQTNAVLVLKQLTHRPDAPVAQVVDIVIVSKAVLQVHIIVDGGNNILLGDMFGHQLMRILLDGLGQLLRIIGELLQNPGQHREVNFLMDAEILGAAVHITGQIHHHIGENLYVLLLCLDVYKRNGSVLNGICQLRCNLCARRRQDLSRLRIHRIRGQNLVTDPVAESQLLVKFISSHLGQVIPAGVKEHGIDQTLSALHAQRLTGTDLLVQLQKAFLIILRSVLGKTGLNLRLLPEHFPDLIVAANAQSTDQNGHGHLTSSVHTHIEHIIGVSLILKPGSSVGNHRTGVEPFTDLVMAYGIVNAGRTHQLADNDALCPIYHKCPCFRHQRKVAHKNLMFADLFLLLVIQADCHRQRGRIGGISLLAFLNRIFHVVSAQFKVDKFKAQGTAVICNRGDIVESLPQTLVKKPLIGILLDFNQVGHLQNLFLPCITHTRNFGTGNWTYSVFLH